MAKVLVTGAAGFIGSQLAFRLWQDGEEIVLIDNFSYGSEDNLIFEKRDFREEIYRKDIRDLEFMEELFRKERFDYVYHIAAITPLPDCQNGPVEAVDVNVRGTTIILDLVRRYGIKKMFFASTSAVYENCTEYPSVEYKVVPPSLLIPVQNMPRNSSVGHFMTLMEFLLSASGLQMYMVLTSTVCGHNLL